MQEQTLSQEEKQSIDAMNKIKKDYERELEKYNRFSERYKRESCKYSFYVWKSRLNKDFTPNKDQKLAISNYAYQIGMVGENMNNLILKLDNVDTYGNENIRQTRKDLIKTIQKSIDTNDKLYRQAKRLNQLYIDHFFPPEKMEEENQNSNENEESESQSEVEEEEEENSNRNSYSNENERIPAPPSLETSSSSLPPMEEEENNNNSNNNSFSKKNNNENNSNNNNNNKRKHHNKTHNKNKNNNNKQRNIYQNIDEAIRQLQEEQQQREMQRQNSEPQFVESSRHINRKWIPRYKLNRYGRDIELRVELPYVKEENIEISLDPDNDTINISGMRNLDEMYTRFNSMKHINNPNYDYFELEVPIELSKIDTENIRYEFEDYILRVIFPSKRIINNNSRYLNNWFNDDFYSPNPFFAF